MNNANVLITGQIGSGKTTLAKHLLRRAPRAVVFDPVADYGPEFGYVTEDVRDAIDAAVEARGIDFCVILRGQSPRDFALMLRLLEGMQRREPQHGPVALFLEESAFYSDLHHILPELKRTFELGRRWRINSVSIIQRDTAINPTIRMNTQIYVSMRQVKLSSDYQSLFDRDAVRGLTNLKPGMKPRAGTHYLTAPEELDLFRTWADINRR